MALIDLIVHRYDRLTYWQWGTRDFYGIQVLLKTLCATRNHEWRVVRSERDGPPGDVAIMHVDCTFVPEEYQALAARYSKCLNSACVDISKRRVSMALLERHPGWAGPVIVKTNLNTRGGMERAHNRRAQRRLQRPPHPDVPRFDRYRVFGHPDAVPPELRDDPDLVTEIFVPERRHGLVGSRSWIFCGDHGRSVRRLGPDEILRHDNLTRTDYVDMPDLHDQRRALGFEYGKFDYVELDGKPLLIDAAKTIGAATARHGAFAREPERFAAALERALGID